MSESLWNHLGIIFIVLAPLFVFWLDLRHRQSQLHVENRERLTRIETMIEPVWKWWTGRINGGNGGNK